MYIQINTPITSNPIKIYTNNNTSIIDILPFVETFYILLYFI